MSLTRWEPLKDIEDLFDRYTMSLPWPRLRSSAIAGVAEWSPRVDIAESDDAYQIHADIPGVEKGDLNVSVQDGVLTIQGERRQEQRDDNARIHRLERFYGSFTRSFTLPADADIAGLKASSSDGQLTVTVPKKASSPAAEAVQVPVQ
jgi:HSP20 family protein